MKGIAIRHRPTFKTFVFLAAILSGPLPSVQAQSKPEPVVARVHWVTLHARTPETFDALVALLSRDLGLPVYFGPEQHGSRRYAAVLAGEVILEPCGPFPTSPYRSDAVLARWNTLSLRPYRSSAASIAELDRRGIEHGPPETQTLDGKQVNVAITGLTAPGMPVSLSECVEGQEALNAKLDSLRGELKAAKGGPLGIREIDEIHIGCSTEDRLARWRTFLGPAEPTDGLWPLSARPHLRLVRAPRDEIVAIVFKVDSLARAAEQLKAMKLLGEKQGDRVSLDESRTGGLKISLRE